MLSDNPPGAAKSSDDNKPHRFWLCFSDDDHHSSARVALMIAPDPVPFLTTHRVRIIYFDLHHWQRCPKKCPVRRLSLIWSKVPRRGGRVLWHLFRFCCFSKVWLTLCMWSFLPEQGRLVVLLTRERNRGPGDYHWAGRLWERWLTFRSAWKCLCVLWMSFGGHYFTMVYNFSFFRSRLWLAIIEQERSLYVWKKYWYSSPIWDGQLISQYNICLGRWTNVSWLMSLLLICSLSFWAYAQLRRTLRFREKPVADCFVIARIQKAMCKAGAASLRTPYLECSCSKLVGKFCVWIERVKKRIY